MSLVINRVNLMENCLFVCWVIILFVGFHSKSIYLDFYNLLFTWNLRFCWMFFVVLFKIVEYFLVFAECQQFEENLLSFCAQSHVLWFSWIFKTRFSMSRSGSQQHLTDGYTWSQKERKCGKSGTLFFEMQRFSAMLKAKERLEIFA